MADTYKYDYNNMASVASAVTPDDSTDLTEVAKGVYVGGAGTLKVDMGDGGTVTFSGLSAGVFLPIIVKRIYATGTTATNIIALQ
jgi:hypothetical protein